MEVQVTLVSPLLGETLPLPIYGSEGAAGLDLCACIEAPLTLKPMERAMVPTGLAIALEGADYAAFLYARSGLSVRHGITLINGVGVVDSDYRGEIKVGLINLSAEAYTIQPGDRIAQLVISPVVQAKVQFVTALSQTQRGSGGFGSTGL